MQDIIQISTHRHNGLYDITRQVRDSVKKSGVRKGMVSVYVQGATAAIMIQENWDESVQNDNGDAHLKAGLVGPSETIPILEGKLGLSTWQNIFLCEFDGPRTSRRIILTVVEA
jgi:thiamine phosphate synthase YjbQ (UPF0047 family)